MMIYLPAEENPRKYQLGDCWKIVELVIADFEVNMYLNYIIIHKIFGLRIFQGI